MSQQRSTTRTRGRTRSHALPALAVAFVSFACACAAEAKPRSTSRTNAPTIEGGVAGDSTSVDATVGTASAGASASAIPDTSAQTDADAPTPNADLDPSLTFDWKASLPGQGTCKPGKYTGSFTCDFVPAGGTASVVTVSGPVTITLQKSMSGEFLEIADASLDGSLDTQTLVLSGIWMLWNMTVGTCNGPWTVSYTP